MLMREKCIKIWRWCWLNTLKIHYVDKEEFCTYGRSDAIEVGGIISRRDFMKAWCLTAYLFGTKSSLAFHPMRTWGVGGCTPHHARAHTHTHMQDGEVCSRGAHSPGHGFWGKTRLLDFLKFFHSHLRVCRYSVSIPCEFVSMRLPLCVYDLHWPHKQVKCWIVHVSFL